MYVLDLENQRVVHEHLDEWSSKSATMDAAVRILIGANIVCNTKNTDLLVLEHFECEISGNKKSGTLFRLLNSRLAIFATELEAEFEFIGPYDLEKNEMGHFIVNIIGEA
tara:strand:- start:1389 stop:1718 length:330 start_codon:yes stop_codon:yes gene_type:complete